MNTSRLVAAWRFALAVLWLGAGAAAGAQTVLKVGQFDQDRSHFDTGTNVFCDTLVQRTRARFGCERSGDAASGPELLAALLDGRLEVINVPVNTLEAQVPELGLFSIPFLFRDAAHARRTVDGGIGDALLDKLPAVGVVGLAWTELGLHHISNSVRAVTTADDVRALKLCTMGSSSLQPDGLHALQIETRTIPSALLYDALRDGDVDGTEAPLPVMLDGQFSSVQQHLSLTGHLYTPGLILISSSRWAQLGADDRRRFVEAARRGASAQLRKINRDNRIALSLLKKNGMQVVERIDRESFRSAMAPAHAEYAKVFGAATLAAVQAVE